MRKKTAPVLITGSFDPVTRGHEDIIRRVSEKFDRVRVTVFQSDTKVGMFPHECRLSFLRAVCAKFGNVEVDVDHGMVADYVKREGISLIVRAVRDPSDALYEAEMAEFNRRASGVETLLLFADPTLRAVSSSAVRQGLREGKDVSALLPTEIADDLKENWQKFSYFAE